MRLVTLVILAFAFLCQGGLSQEATQILNLSGGKAIKDAAAYGIGHDIGSNLAQGGLSAEDFSTDDLLAGILDALNGKDLAVQPQQIQSAMELLGQKVQKRMAAKAENNLAASKKYLEQNKQRQGVASTDSGLQYEVLKSGNGASPTLQSTVTVHYEGKLISGKIFDSSMQRGTPATFGVSQVIPGWTEALLRMKVGDKWKLFIPPELGYGPNGAGGDIGPNEALVFEVELIEVK
ncbi:MAG: FKBP-type peptidyl-prolyl cis-trans isomerase [Planctomycetales bacterium]|nr:FKBP-type peptidyl-prolyl cis-trans isomerase [Planctomycetales bacterium]